MYVLYFIYTKGNILLLLTLFFCVCYASDLVGALLDSGEFGQQVALLVSPKVLTGRARPS